MDSVVSLDERLEQIRSSPKLQNQQHTAIVLSSIDERLQSQNVERSPTAYFSALLSVLPHYLPTASPPPNKDLAYAVVYLLGLVTPHVSTPLLRAKFSQILTSLTPSFLPSDHQNTEAEAPLLRSAIGCVECLVIVQDAHSWSLPANVSSPRRAIAGLLNLAVDRRPKVRKRALDALRRIIETGLPGPKIDHPALDQCAESALRALQTESSAGKERRKNKDETQIIHALQLVKIVAGFGNGWPSKRLDVLCELLLEISKSNSEYLVLAVFEVFEIIFAGMTDEVSSAKLPRLLEIITELKPSVEDTSITPSWLAVLSRGYAVAAQTDPDTIFYKIPELFTLVSTYLESPAHNSRLSASECLRSILNTCIPENVIIEPSIMDQKMFEKIGRKVEDLLNVKYQSAWMEVFSIVVAAFESLRWHSTVLQNALETIGGLRSDEGFTGKKEADAVIGAAITAIGPKSVLDILPLNLVKSKKIGRAWLLPIMRTAVKNTDLAHFRSELVPLSEVMFQRVLNHGTAPKTMEIKVFETVVQQVWATLPGYCELPLDLTQAFDQSFAEMLANLLYQQPQLRTDICRGLQNLILSNQAIEAVETEDLLAQGRVTKTQAIANMKHLSSFANNLLAVLFNIYGETLPQYRGLILQCINSYWSIIPKEELVSTFERLATMLDGAIIEEASKPKSKEANKMPPTSHTLMDLVITMSVHLPRTSFAALFNMAANVVNRDDDPQLQKKAYKMIPRLAESKSGQDAVLERNVELQTLLLQAASKATAPARRDRNDAIAQIIPHLSQSDLHFIPSILSEIVMGVKEVNEKARTSAFDLLVLMGEKMSEGGTVVNSNVPHMSADAVPVTASLEEYFTMVGAGLAGSTPHMVSACITALARLLFEFKSRLTEATITDLIQTIDLYLTSSNREIVRSCLGFVKVCVLSLPKEMMLPRLESLIPNLCVWSHEHKAQVKAKVKHIFERMIKRFSVEVVEKYTPEADRKLVANIRKTRDRAARKKETDNNNNEDNDENNNNHDGKARFESEYDEALYASSDDDENFDDDDNDSDTGITKKHDRNKKKNTTNGTYILEDESEPLDLLDRSTLGKISNTKPKAKRTIPSQNQKKATYDLDGKLVFTDQNDSKKDVDVDMLDDESQGIATKEELEKGINAYVEAISSRDAATRGQRGKLKFKNVLTRGKDQNGDDGDDGDEGEEIKKAVMEHRSNSSRGRGRGNSSFGRGRGDSNGGRGRGESNGGRGRGSFSGGRGRGSFSGGRGRGSFSGGRGSDRRGLGMDRKREGDGGIRKRTNDRAPGRGRGSNKFKPKGQQKR